MITGCRFLVRSIIVPTLLGARFAYRLFENDNADASLSRKYFHSYYLCPILIISYSLMSHTQMDEVRLPIEQIYFKISAMPPKFSLSGESLLTFILAYIQKQAALRKNY